MEAAISRRRAAIIGSGSIGIDLMYKAMRSPHLDLKMVVGRSLASEGLARARELGIATSAEGIGFLAHHASGIDIVFDATSAQSHRINDPFFRKANLLAIDMTPAKIGAICVPSINLDNMAAERNVNLVTCGGQASIPLAYAIAQAFDTLEYIEVASTIASDSAGLATRENINQYILTTEQALRQFSGAGKSKAVLNINPAKPGINMQTTVFAKGRYQSLEKVKASVREMVARVQRYVPGYEVVLEPVETKGYLTVSVTVRGSGDYLPAYAGNLDIINCAAIAVAEFNAVCWERTAA
ncbi:MULTISPECIES: acetaldehyde dehydrogenase (acetylating) [unclassified Pseudomonas]|uniref:acetaldehyde dehydrogenase (acetylating) n=1 Tax=unclassified Pseudomonas TaxID=196821 RepID=UPI000BCFE37A|nr:MULTISPECIES: acetaldehyde dehydrogenase (acetylating) [unclassified Pseudomonas]PVZ15393.1 acetaldehyde dehydrogenase [Pseudomonas sp. URIL14HWK12:I12]PVZ24767.1 acetaldehyde dehydrogenase [Pseudomonas sp. URIL14HWK12:I10]PVZ34613.1 acetaldehyde dehydrogenase [Pseudomonas sp. URIL14HWK12:I11]SNZ08785.1 acetaldehyde dehydrogenase [Pseudomonas sp. URIL14HWK12:I9]